MKKLIMFVMVLMLCLGTAAKADLVAAWSFDETLDPYPDAGDYPAEMYEGSEAYDCEGPPPGGCAIALDGTNSVSVELPLGAANPLDHTADWSIALWFKVPEMAAEAGAMLLSSAIDDVGDNHSYALFLEPGVVGTQGALRVDMFYVATVIGDTVDLDDGGWHHVAVVFDETSGFTTLYLDGVEDGSNDEIGETIPDIADNTILIGDTLNEEFPAEEGVEPLVGSIAHVGLYNEALDAAGIAEAMDPGFPGYGPKNPINVDPNQMEVSETDETEGNFKVSLKFPPLGQEPAAKAPDGTPISMEITVDPNGFSGGGNPDITLIGGSGPHNRISFTRTGANWDVPEVIRFKAIDDDLPEPQATGDTMAEPQNIVVWAVPTPHEPNLAQPVAQKVVGGVVFDNDQANILFRVTPMRGGPKQPVIGPVQLWEQYTAGDLLKWRKIFFKMQVKPVNAEDPCSPTSVKANAVVEGEVEGDNLPHTDPCLPYEDADDPNGFTFTSTTSTGETGLAGDCPDWNTGTKTSCWDVEQPIKIWGNDDTVLQIEDAAADGDEDYHAVLIVTVVEDGGDERFTGMERTVQFDIEDNECGAFGISYLDIGNPNAFTDPNFRDEDGNPLPDCYIDIYDVIEMATRWLSCTNPQDPGCQHAQPL